MIRNYSIGEYAQSALFAAFLYLAITGFMAWKEEPATAKA